MRIAVVLALVACGSPGREPRENSGHFHIELVRNDANHSAVIELLLHQPEEPAFAVIGQDGVAAGYTPDGFFTFETYDEGYRLLVSVDGRSFEVQHHVGHLELVNREVGRRHPAPVTLPATAIELAPSGPAPALPAGSTVYVATTGIWTLTDTGQTAVTYTLPWQMVRAPDAELGLLVPDDRVVLYTFEPCAGCGYRALTQIVDASFAQVDGQPQVVSDPLRTPAERQDVTLAIGRADELARVAPAFGFAAGTASWGLDSIPSIELGPLGRLPLVASTDAAAGNVAATVPVSNVFAGTHVVGWLETRFVRVVDGVPLVHGTLQLVPVDDTGHLAIAGSVGVPGEPTIDGLDGTDDPTVSWALAVAGPVHDHVVTLFELGDAGISERRTILTDRQVVPLARELLVPGHRYVVRVDARLGFPGAPDGNYVTTEFPFETASTWSAPFEIP
jgi:hypothetical protein